MCPCVRVCINHLLVRTITHHPVKLESPNLVYRSKRPFKVPIVLRGDRPWPPRSNLTWKLNFTSLPEAVLAYGYCHRLCLCVGVYLYVCQLLIVRTITHHTFQLESPDLDEKVQNSLLKVPIVLGADWARPSMSNLTSFQNSVYFHHFCVFEIFVRHAKMEFVELLHIAHGAAHILIPIYACRQGRAMDRETI